MKITKSKLKQFILEEAQELLQEDRRDIFSPSDQPKSETLPWTTALGRLINKYADLFPEATGQKGTGVHVPAGAAAAGNVYGPAYHRPTGFRDPAMEETEGPITTYVDVQPGREPAGVKRRIPAPFLRAGDPMTWPFPGEVAAAPPSIRHQYEDQPGWTAAGSAAEAAALAAGIRVPSMPRLKPITGLQHGKGLTQHGLFQPGPPASAPWRPMQVQKGFELDPATNKLRTVGSGGERIFYAGESGPALGPMSRGRALTRTGERISRPDFPENYDDFLRSFEEALEQSLNRPLTQKEMTNIVGPRAAAAWEASYKWGGPGLPQIKPPPGIRGAELGPYNKTISNREYEEIVRKFQEAVTRRGGREPRIANAFKNIFDDMAKPIADAQTGEILGWTLDPREYEIMAKRLGLEKIGLEGTPSVLPQYVRPPRGPATIHRFPSGEKIDESISKSKFKKIIKEEYNKLLKESAAQYIWGVKAPYNRVANKYNLHRMSSEKLSKLKL